jgi:hypothetical protein
MRLLGGKGGTNCGKDKGPRFYKDFGGVFKSIIQTIKKVTKLFKSINILISLSNFYLYLVFVTGVD